MIQMIAGVYGRKMPDGSVKPMDKNSGPFEVSAEKEERLIRLGLAVRVDHVDTEMPIGFDETPPVVDGEDETDETEAETEEVDLEALTVNELREIGKQYGVAFKVGMKKADMIAAIEAAQSEDDAAEDDGEDAPVFDASEAVL